MDDEYPPSPGLWLRANAIVHAALMAVMLCGIAGTAIWFYRDYGNEAVPFLMVFLPLSIAVSLPVWLGMYLYYRALVKRSEKGAAFLAVLYYFEGAIVTCFTAFAAVWLLDNPQTLMEFLWPFAVIAYLVISGLMMQRWGHRLASWRNQPVPRCPACDYSLRGLDPRVSNTCPECGAEIAERLNQSGRPG